MFELNKNKLILDVKNLEKELGKRPTRHHNSSLYRKSRKYFGSWNKMMEKAGYKVRYYQYPKIPKKLTPDLSYFLGLTITDGHIRNHRTHYGIYLYTSYLEEITLIVKLIKNLFNYNANIYRKKKFGFNKRFNFQITINSKALVDCLNEKFNMPIGNKSLIVRVPEIITNSDNEIVSNFIRGVIDGDGHITQKTVHISSGSYLFLIDIKSLFSKFLIDCNAKIERKKTCYVLNLNTHESNLIYHICYEKAKYYYQRKREKFLKTNIFKNMN